jgi:hypothetical protein
LVILIVTVNSSQHTPHVVVNAVVLLSVSCIMYKRRTGFSVPFKGATAAGTANQAASTTIVAANTVKPAADHADTTAAEEGPEKENYAPVSVQLPVFKKPKLFQAPAAAAGAQQQNRQAAPQQQTPAAAAAAETGAGDAIAFAVLYTKRAKFSVCGADTRMRRT